MEYYTIIINWANFSIIFLREERIGIISSSDKKEDSRKYMQDLKYKHGK
jgi:hypothetical protein